MSPTCSKHCKNGSLQCPTPYTCGLYHLEAQLPLHIDAPDLSATVQEAEKPLPWRDLALITVAFMGACGVIVAIVGWSLK